MKVNPVPCQTGGMNRILVSYGGALMWSLATNECQTWFVSHLRYLATAEVANLARHLLLTSMPFGHETLSSGVKIV